MAQNDANDSNDVNEFLGVSLTIQAVIQIFLHFKTNIFNLDIFKHKMHFHFNMLEKLKIHAIYPKIKWKKGGVYIFHGLNQLVQVVLTG